MMLSQGELYLAALEHLLRFARIPQYQREYFGELLERGRAEQKRSSPQQMASGAGGGGSPP
jgi:hypothetical protein